MSDNVASHGGLLSSSSWLQLTPVDTVEHGVTCLVNMSRATSVWEVKTGAEIWFGAQHVDEKFEVKETVGEIANLLYIQPAPPPSAPPPGSTAATTAAKTSASVASHK